MSKLILSKGFILREAPDGLELLDTGSPRSMPPPPGTLEHVHPETVRVIGMDTLGKSPFRLDWSAGTIELDAPPPAAAPLKWSMSIRQPSTELEVVGLGKRLAVIDTAAQVGFAPARDLTPWKPVAKFADFHPLIGAFSTQLWEVRVRWTGVDQTVRVGTLPPAFEARAAAELGGAWVLGGSFLAGRPIWISATDRTIAPG